MKYLYNDELEINDLIRDAHPYGGTEVLAIDSCEGHVEDVIENQMKTLDMVFKQPVIETLANLGNELDKEGLYSLASSVDKLLSGLTKEASPVLVGGGILSLLAGGAIGWQLWKGIQEEFIVDLRDLKRNVAGWYKDKEYAGQAADTLYGLILNIEKEYMLLDKNIVKGIKDPNDNDVYAEIVEAGDKISYYLGKTDEFIQYFSRKHHGWTGLDFSRTRGLMEDLKFSWGELVNSVKALSDGQSIEIVQEETDDRKKSRETEDKVETKQKGTGKGSGKGSKGSGLLLRIQQAVNKILGKKVLSETKKDPALWSVIKGEPFLGQKNTMLNKAKERKTYKNYNEMYAILSTYLSGESAKSKMKDRTEITHVNFNMGGVEVQHFPITRALHFVNKNNQQAMAKATNLFIAWLKQTTQLPVPVLNYSDMNSVSQMAGFLHKVSLAINQGKPTDGTNVTREGNYGTAFPRMISYIGELSQFLLVFAEKLRAAKELKDKQLANAKNIFDFLAAQWTHAKPAHPFFFLIKNAQAKQDLLNYMVDMGIADKQARMIVSESRVIGLMPRIETQVKNLVRNYGIR